MKSRREFRALLLPLVLARDSAGAAAQDAAPSLAGLSAQVKALGEQLRQVSALATRQQQAIVDLRATNETLHSHLGCLLKFSSGHDVVFDGCNVHIQNGTGSTTKTNSFGNLIIGYNKNEVSPRKGSHNLVIGDLHEYSSYGGVVSGTRGFVAASGGFGVVVGGLENRVTVAGTLNEAAGSSALACAGSENVATSSHSLVCGGAENHSDGLDSVAIGGHANTAASRASVVTGGGHCATAIDDKWVVGLLDGSGCSAIAN